MIVAATSRDLKAGGWSVRLTERGTLSDIFLGEDEVLRGLAVVVRDADWGTVEGEVDVHELRRGENSFVVSLASRHRRDDIDFTWQGSITGTPEGVLRFAFEGTAGSGFRSNRIGLVALHSLNWAGRQVDVVHSDGSVSTTSYPALVSPHQPFLDVAELRQVAPSGHEVRIAFEGDVFETEDQRNWSDASFKSYSRPLALPFPVEFHAGEIVSQALTLTANGRISGGRERGTDTVTVTVGDDEYAWPAIGVGFAADGAAADATLADLEVAWVRVDVALRSHGAVEGAELLVRAAATGVPIELCITVDAHAPEDVGQLARVLAGHDIAAVLVYTDGVPVASDASIECVRAVLQDLPEAASVPVVAGTDGNLAELNRNARDFSRLDGVTLSINAQVHDSSNAAIMHTTEAYEAMIATVREITKQSSVTISPLTLKPRRNLYATATAESRDAEADTIDERQSTRFGAAWAAAAIGELARAGASRLTVFEHAGPCGLASAEGDRWPAFDVVAGATAGVAGVRYSVSRPNKIGGFITETIHGRLAVLANLTTEKVAVHLNGFFHETVTFSIPPFDVVQLNAKEEQ